ncbi:MAG: hypothetical protein VYB44_07065 [Bacteroidota bacterium]|nr:hypothetical protein [Bacteroidota bacterium]
MKNIERSILAGHSLFHQMAAPALVRAIEQERGTLGARPVPLVADVPTPAEQQAIAAWDKKQSRIRSAEGAYQNRGRNEANLFYSKVVEQLFEDGALTGIEGLTGEFKVMQAKVAQISDEAVDAAVLAVYNRM